MGGTYFPGFFSSGFCSWTGGVERGFDATILLSPRAAGGRYAFDEVLEKIEFGGGWLTDVLGAKELDCGRGDGPVFGTAFAPPCTWCHPSALKTQIYYLKCQQWTNLYFAVFISSVLAFSSLTLMAAAARVGKASSLLISTFIPWPPNRDVPPVRDAGGRYFVEAGTIAAGSSVLETSSTF